MAPPTSSTLPSYYIPPPHPSHITRSTSTSTSASSSTAKLPKRPAIFDNLFTDLLFALGNSSSDTEAEPKTSKSVVPQIRTESTNHLSVNNELRKLKHSISDRNLSDIRRSTHDIQLIDQLLLTHRNEIKEFTQIKHELEKEKEINKQLRKENEDLRMEFMSKLEENKKANRKALRILMGLQKQEFLTWSEEINGRNLSPYLDEIDQGVKRRINDWERNARSSGGVEEKILKVEDYRNPNIQRRSSSPESDINDRKITNKHRINGNGRRSPSKSVRIKTKPQQISKLSPIREKQPFAR